MDHTVEIIIDLALWNISPWLTNYIWPFGFADGKNGKQMLQVHSALAIAAVVVVTTSASPAPDHGNHGAGWQFYGLFVGPSFGPTIFPSFGQSVKLKRSYVQTVQMAILRAQNHGLRIGPSFGLKFLKSIELPPRFPPRARLLRTSPQRGAIV